MQGRVPVVDGTDKVAAKRKLFGLKAMGRSRVTNGKELLPHVDGRSIWARRFRDLYSLILSDLGGEAAPLSEGQKIIARRSSALVTELERLEVKFATAGGATLDQLDAYQRVVNTLRRTLESLGIHRGRIPLDLTPPTLEQYLAGKTRRVRPGSAEDEEAVA